LSALAFGATAIWVMHFTAMLGYTIRGETILYDIPVTLLSMFVAVASVGLALTAPAGAALGSAAPGRAAPGSAAPGSPNTGNGSPGSRPAPYLSEQEYARLMNGLRDLVQLLREADPLTRTLLYRQLGIQLADDPQPDPLAARRRAVR
jgi:hypothetical protein